MRRYARIAWVVAAIAAGCGGSGDTSGAVSAVERDVNGDGVVDLIVGAPLEDVGGRVYVFFGPLSPDTSYLAPSGNVAAVGALKADVVLDSEPRQNGEPRPDLFGAAVTTGDVDGDGIADLLVGAPGFDGAGPDATGEDSNIGRAYLFLGGGGFASGTAAQADVILYGQPRIAGDTGGGAFGFSVETGDLDGDGTVDVAVGAVGYDRAAGRAYLYRGTRLQPGARIEAATADQILAGEAENHFFGYALAAGDIGLDGIKDLAVGAPDAGPGRVYLFPGGAPLLTPGAPQQGVVLDGEAQDDLFGTALRAADFDSDGAPDLAVGAPGYDLDETEAIGRCYVFAARTIASKPARLADVIITGEEAGDFFGSSVGAGDIDADEHVDLIVGAPGAGEGVYDPETLRLEGADVGRAYVFLGGSRLIPVDGPTIRLGALDSVLRLTGERTEERLGTTVSAADVDRDGIADLLAGAPPRDAGIVGIAFVVAGAPGLADDLLTGEASMAVLGRVADDEFSAAIR